MADLLLSTPEYSLDCRFFGALTYTVNLNHYKSFHENIDVNQILEKLLIHLSNLINDLRQNNTSNIFIIRKTLSNLSLIFNSYTLKDTIWTNPLNSLIYLLESNQPPSIEQLNIDVNIIEFVRNQDLKSIDLLLNFSSIIVEDLLRIGVDKKKDHIHEYVNQNVYPVTKSLLTLIFESGSVDAIVSGLETLQAWISYVSFAEYNTSSRYRDLNELLQFLIVFLQHPEEELSSNAIEILTDIFENNPLLVSFELRERFKGILMSQWSLDKINEFMKEEDFDSLTNFASLIIAFLEIDSIQLTSNIMRGKNNEFLRFLLNLTNFPASPIIQENVSLRFIEFWCQIIEIFIDDMDVLENTLKNDPNVIQEVVENSKNLFQELTMIYFNKIQFTIFANSEFRQYQQEFFSFRNDTMELFDLTFTKLGPQLFEQLTSTILSSSEINNIEASLFILTALSLNFTADNVSEQIITSVENLFQANFLSNYNTLTSKVPSHSEHYVKTAIRFLGSLEFFYNKRDTQYLNSVINYLFICLKDHPSQQFSIAKTIYEICDTCRTQLVSSINDFEPILLELIKNPEINNYTREKFIISISCIIQSLPDPSTQENHIYHILDLIESTAEPYLNKATQNNLAPAEMEYLISLFTCVLEVGKGMSVPEELAEDNIDLYKAFYDYYKQHSHRVQNKTIRLINIFSIEIPVLADLTEITEKACMIFKIGLLEDFGPFAFSNEYVLNFALAKSAHKSSSDTLVHIIELLNLLINTGLRLKSTNSPVLTQSDISNIVQHFIIHHYQLISQDPDLLQISLGLLTSILNQKPEYLLHDETSFSFAIQTATSLLYSHEKFVIKAASKFWITFLSTRKTTLEDTKRVQEIVESELGQTLTFKLFESMIDAARSDVDTYSSIIVVFFSKYQLHFKDWCRTALAQIDQQRQQNGKRPIQDRELFIKKLLVTRGSTRKCNELIKEFWITTNGMISYT